MSKAIVFGALGQDGSYMCELLLDKGWDVVGIVSNLVNRTFPSNKLLLYNIQVSKSTSYQDLLKELEILLRVHDDAEVIFNFFGMTSQQECWDDPKTALFFNAVFVEALLNRVKAITPEAKVFIAGSGSMYGDWVDERQELTDEFNFSPRSPYDISKVAAFDICTRYLCEDNLKIKFGVLFSPDSPRRSARFFIRQITSAVAKWKIGDRETRLVIGDTSSLRQFGHAKDYVEEIFKRVILSTISDSNIFILGTALRPVENFLQLVLLEAGLNEDLQVKFLIERNTDLSKDKKYEYGVRYSSLYKEMPDAIARLAKEMLENDLQILSSKR